MKTLICAVCQKEYAVKDYRAESSRCCSRACAGEYKRKQKQNELLGNRFGRLTIIGFEAGGGRHFRVLCKCDCGNVKPYIYDCLRSGGTISCGCYAKERRSTANGLSRSRLYKVWTSMKNRCYDPNMDNYQYYGGRGITVCDEWKGNFLAFYEWAMANGYDENEKYMECTLDRIDVNGNYEPQNCRWIGAKQQVLNKRNSTLYLYNGENLTIPQLAVKYGKSEIAIKSRIKLGFTIEQAIEQSPVARRR